MSMSEIDDLLVRLRNPAWITRDSGTWLSSTAVDDMEEAADEIEWLQNVVATGVIISREDLDTMVSYLGGFMGSVDSYREVEKIRARMRGILAE